MTLSGRGISNLDPHPPLGERRPLPVRERLLGGGGILLFLEAGIVAREGACWLIDLGDFDCLAASRRWSD